MLKRLLTTAVMIFAAIAAGVGLAVLPRVDAAASPQLLAEAGPRDALPPDPSPEEPAASKNTGYLLGEYNGRVSVLSPDTREPEMIFDIFIRTLPDADQELLRQGIRVDTYEELTRLIEDYIS